MGEINRGRILYGMCYDISEQPHTSYKTDTGLAVFCRETPLWIRLARGYTISAAQAFFMDFLRQNDEPFTGIVAEKAVAEICAKIYANAKNISFTQKELMAYYLPPQIKLSENNLPGDLHTASSPDMPLILEWIQAFYKETLHADSPDFYTQKTNGPLSSPLPKLFVLRDSQPVAMGMLTGSGETSRLNLIYVLPAFRRNGYGKSIISALSQKAREAGQIPMLYTAAANTAANNLYTSLGFKEAGRLTEVRFKSGLT